jgi:hypothetical protein
MFPKRFPYVMALLSAPLAVAQVQLQFAFPQFGAAVAPGRFASPTSTNPFPAPQRADNHRIGAVAFYLVNQCGTRCGCTVAPEQGASVGLSSSASIAASVWFLSRNKMFRTEVGSSLFRISSRLPQNPSQTAAANSGLTLRPRSGTSFRRFSP